MSEPIILNGGGQMITIQLPSFKKMTSEGFFSVTPKSETEQFQTIVITDKETKIEVLIPIKARLWTIEIK